MDEVAVGLIRLVQDHSMIVSQDEDDNCMRWNNRTRGPNDM